MIESQTSGDEDVTSAGRPIGSNPPAATLHECIDVAELERTFQPIHCWPGVMGCTAHELLEWEEFHSVNRPGWAELWTFSLRANRNYWHFQAKVEVVGGREKNACDCFDGSNAKPDPADGVLTSPTKPGTNIFIYKYLLNPPYLQPFCWLAYYWSPSLVWKRVKALCLGSIPSHTGIISGHHSWSQEIPNIGHHAACQLEALRLSCQKTKSHRSWKPWETRWANRSH